jgi:hypothetical protein
MGEGVTLLLERKSSAPLSEYHHLLCLPQRIWQFIVLVLPAKDYSLYQDSPVLLFLS